MSNFAHTSTDWMQQQCVFSVATTWIDTSKSGDNIADLAAYEHPQATNRPF